MRVVGLDPAYANFGLVAADLLHGNAGWAIIPYAMDLIQTKPTKDKKVVRKSSDKLARAVELHRGVHAFLEEYKPGLVFVEVPSGAQDANAAAGLGLAVGIIASIRLPIIEVAPGEIKRLFTSKQEAVPKSTVMHWAYQQWPNAPWLTHAKKRTLKNEHLADALACIKAGLTTPTFLQLLSLRGLNETPVPDHNGPASRRSSQRRVPLESVPVDQPAGKRIRHQIHTDSR